ADLGWKLWYGPSDEDRKRAMMLNQAAAAIESGTAKLPAVALALKNLGQAYVSGEVGGSRAQADALKQQMGQGWSQANELMWLYAQILFLRLATAYYGKSWYEKGELHGHVAEVIAEFVALAYAPEALALKAETLGKWIQAMKALQKTATAAKEEKLAAAI